jgi:hypothetical protein
MYERYPTSAAPQNLAGTEPPRSVLNAVRLMYAGAGLSAVVVIVTLATIGGLRAAILARYPHYSPSQVHTAEEGFIATDVLSGLIAIGLWLWMAWANRRGRNWARYVSAVFFGINTLNLLGAFVQVHNVGTAIVAIAVWLVGAGAIMLIFNRESTPYYRPSKLL